MLSVVMVFTVVVALSIAYSFHSKMHSDVQALQITCNKSTVKPTEV